MNHPAIGVAKPGYATSHHPRVSCRFPVRESPHISWFNGNSRILKWRSCTIFIHFSGHLNCGEIPIDSICHGLCGLFFYNPSTCPACQGWLRAVSRLKRVPQHSFCSVSGKGQATGDLSFLELINPSSWQRVCTIKESRTHHMGKWS